ncbi:serum amyloid P-component-like [Polypterus senegalus]|uniref:serum amyloid P-component-like n=1 Tax=Polypterus senegalus TaxID=55291 RepID=UPI001963DD9A|nr:serum amyloid P-component-like [Polypterus senegalus]
MEQLLFFIFLLGISAGSAEDLSRKIFTFPTTSSSAFVKLKPNMEGDLQNVTVCLKYATDLSRENSLFSLATPTNQNAFLIFNVKPGIVRLHVGSAAHADFWVPQAKEVLPPWTHICATWESGSGLGQLWINGMGTVRKGISKGFKLNEKISILLGQEQDSFGGGFDSSQSFVGQISDVHMWNYVLSPCDIIGVYNSFNFTPGNVLNWKEMQYELHGYVILESESKMQCQSGYS